MTLTLGGPGVACSALRVRRLLAGELANGERARAEEHLSGCARCQMVREEIEAERRELERALPFERFAAGVAERMAERRPAAWRRALPLALAAGLAAAVAVPTALRLAGDREAPNRLKGGASLTLFAQEGNRVRALAPGEAVAPGSRLRVALAPGTWSDAAVVLVDRDGAAALYAGPARPGPLPDAFEWTGRSREGTLVLLLTDHPVDVAALELRLARGEPAALPGSRAEVLRIRLRRGEAR